MNELWKKYGKYIKIGAPVLVLVVCFIISKWLALGIFVAGVGGLVLWKRDMHWWFGTNSLWCKVMKWLWCYRREITRIVCAETGLLANEWCPNRIEVKFKEGDEPTEFCKVHKAPEFVWVNICQETGQVANQYCPRVELEKFVKGDEPIEVCTVHKEPPTWTGNVCEKSIKLPRKYCIHVKEAMLPEKPSNPALCNLHLTPSYPPKIRDLQAHFLGYWNWFRVNAWAQVNQKQAEDELLETAIETKIHRFDEVDAFGWLSDGKQEHRHLNWKTPWVWEMHLNKRKFHLDIFENRYFELFESFLKIHKIVGLDFGKHLFMSFGYNEYPFRNNFNDVTRFWSAKAIPFQQAFAERVMQSYVKVYGANYKPWVKIINEASHGGNSEMFHTIMDFHWEMWDVLKQYTDLKHIIVDISHCEGALGRLREPHKCPKCGQMHGTDGYNRLAMGEVHGFSTITDFKRGVDGGNREIIDIYLGSANKHRRFTEDAGGISKDGKGEVWGPYVFADKDQCYEMGKYVYGKARSKGKRIVLCPFPVECLKRLVENGKVIYRSDYRVSQIHWDRFEELARAWDETR